MNENYTEIKQQAEEARKNLHWQKAYELYKKLCEFDNANEWDRYFLALSMSKLENYTDSLNMCRKIYDRDKNFVANNSLYARNIFTTIFTKVNYKNPQKILKAIKAMKKLIPKDDKYISFEMYIHKIIKIFERDNQYEFILKTLDVITPDAFDYKIIDDEEYLQRIKYPPFVETYFVARIKANFTLHRYDETILLTDDALSVLKRFNYSNNVWIRRIKAIALSKKENYTEAIKEYFYILRIKKDWFLYFETAKILYKLENRDASEYFALRALQIKQDVIYKVKLFSFIINEINYKLLKDDLEQLLLFLKEKQNELLGKNEIEAKITEIEKIIQEKVNKYFDLKKGTGEIKKIFGKKNGLIETSSGVIYFYVEKKNLEPKQGEKYSFEESWNYDLKKNEVRKSVILIKKI